MQTDLIKLLKRQKSIYLYYFVAFKEKHKFQILIKTFFILPIRNNAMVLYGADCHWAFQRTKVALMATVDVPCTR